MSVRVRCRQHDCGTIASRAEADFWVSFEDGVHRYSYICGDCGVPQTINIDVANWLKLVRAGVEFIATELEDA